jgi:hypothetical protein
VQDGSITPLAFDKVAVSLKGCWLKQAVNQLFERTLLIWLEKGKR